MEPGGRGQRQGFDLKCPIVIHIDLFRRLGGPPRTPPIPRPGPRIDTEGPNEIPLPSRTIYRSRTNQRRTTQITQLMEMSSATSSNGSVMVAPNIITIRTRRPKSKERQGSWPTPFCVSAFAGAQQKTVPSPNGIRSESRRLPTRPSGNITIC